MFCKFDGLVQKALVSPKLCPIKTILQLVCVLFQLQDVSERELMQSYRSPQGASGDGAASGGIQGNGFVVAGGPWEQKLPNTASVTEFPSFGGGRSEEPPQPSPIGGAWGSKR